MRFDMLKQSIDLYASESPSLYNALNIIRSLFQDVEDAANETLSKCPIGDDNLPREMVWLSKELLGIYEDNTAALQKNRLMLDSIMGELRKVQNELETIADATELLPEKEAQYQQLQQQLEAARAAESAYTALLGKIEAAQQDLAQLQRFDMDAARQQLADLLKKILGLENEIRSLDSRIQQKKEEEALLLGNIAANQQALDQLQLNLKQLTKQKEEILEQISQAKQLHTTLTAQIASVRSELVQLDTLICDAKKLLPELQSQLEHLTVEKSQVDEEVARLRQQISVLNNYINTLHTELDQKLRPEHDFLTLKKQQLLEEKLRILNEIASLSTETGSLETELTVLRSSLSLHRQERDEAQKRVDDYRREILDPVISERDALLETEKQLLTEKECAVQKGAELKANQQSLIQQIGNMKAQYERDTETYQKDLQQQQQLIQNQEALTEQLNAITAALANQQRANNKLETEDLPDAQRNLAAETKRLESIQAKIIGLQDEHQKKSESISQFEKELPALQEKVRHLRSVYEALTVTYTASNKDIWALELKIKELEAKNDQERLGRYRAQLQEQERKLEDLAEDCCQLEQQIANQDSKIEAKLSHLQSLQNSKKTKEDGERSIDILLAELKPCDTEEYRRQACSIAIQYENLKIIRQNLEQSIHDASKCIPGYKPTTAESKVQSLESVLTQAAQHSRSLHHTLIECAKAIMQNHITEEPK